MSTDKPKIVLRKKIAALLKAHGEVEQTRHSPDIEVTLLELATVNSG